jgi:adenylate cyclase
MAALDKPETELEKSATVPKKPAATAKKTRTRKTAPDIRKRYREMELLLNLSRKVAESDNLDDVLRTIVATAAIETNSDRGTLFLNDPRTGELFSRVAQGVRVREIRILNTDGIAGHVFTSGEPLVVDDAYKDPRFDSAVDQETGYLTRNMMAVPIRVRGAVIGVLETINRTGGGYTADDRHLLEGVAMQTAATLGSMQLVESIKAARDQEMRFLQLVSDVTREIDLGSMLTKIVSEAARILSADRATLFLHDDKTKELFSRVATGGSIGEIRMPDHLGIAGAVYTSGRSINIPYAYADLRFNPAFDKRTGYFTQSILCVPILNEAGRIIGVTQVLNKRGGPFSDDDEARLRAFTAQLAISLENAQLFDDVQNVKNYNQSMLQSMSNGVVTLNEDGRINTCNQAGLRILRVDPKAILQQTATQFFGETNPWVLERIKVVDQTLTSDVLMDADMVVQGEKVSVNLTVLPLMSEEDNGVRKRLGTLLMIDDISTEKRMKSTMSRYMDPAVAAQLLSGGEEVLGGKSVTATVLFSDIRGFTTLSEELGPIKTVSMLNEYFSIMVEVITKQGGMLDKFIGDALMAAFGLPVAHDDDEDRAVRAAIGMINALKQFNETRAAAGKSPVDIGIGLNTDSVVSGNIGSPRRMDYTIIGDGVNLASRLESACKQYASRILISENTFKKLRGTYRVREVDSVVVKGKHQPVGIYELLDYHTPETFPNLMDAVNYWKSGLEYYRHGDWDRAIKAFGEAGAANPHDKLPPMYIERCQELQQNPPGASWTGVWVMKTK